MNAIISPTRGVIIAYEDGRPVKALGVFHDDRPVSPQLCTQLVREIPDWEEIDTLEEGELQALYTKVDEMSDALSLFLISLDTELTLELRRSAANHVDELLKSPWVVDYLNAILFARSLPPEHGATEMLLSIDLREEAPRYTAFTERFLAMQPQVHAVHKAWECIPPDTFSREGEAKKARYQLMRAGLFYRMAVALHEHKRSDEVLHDALAPTVNEYEQIVETWCSMVAEDEIAYGA